MPEGDTGRRPSVEASPQYWRGRIWDPEKFEDGSFHTTWIDKSKGIKAVIGRPKNSNKMRVQSILFERSRWSKEESLSWLREHWNELRRKL